MTNEASQGNTNHILRLHDYFKYMYEEERHRSEKLNSASNTYLVFITFAFTFTTGLLNWTGNPFGDLLSKNATLIQSILLVVVCFALILIFMSLILTILVVKVYRFERLCNPKDFAVETADINDESLILTSIISHYIVATERNYKVNNTKANFLSYGLKAYVIGFTLLVISLSILALVKG